MTENLAQTLQKVIQDLVAPDVRELKALVVNLQTQINHVESSLQSRILQVETGLQGQINHVESSLQTQLKQVEIGLQKQMDQRFTAQSEKSDAQFAALMAAIGEFKAQSELANMRVIASLSERVAVLETQRH